MIRQAMRRLLAKNPTADGFFRRLVWSRVHFPEHELRTLHALPKGYFDVAVDVGAALGSYTWVLNRKARRVIAFEPGAKHHAHIRAALLGSHVTLTRAAVGKTSGTAELFTPEQTNDGRHMATLSVFNPVTQTPKVVRESVDVISLDIFLETHLENDARVDLRKIDVEGFECAVLAGAKGRIAKDHPVIIAEVEARHNPDYRRFFSNLSNMGYACLAWRSDQYSSITPEEVGAQHAPDHFNHSGDHYAGDYINNFIFQHPQSAAKVVNI